MTVTCPNFPVLRKPVVVFDAGIGSYAAVAALQRALPEAGSRLFRRSSELPHGGKSRQELLDTMKRTLTFLARFDPAAILVASMPRRSPCWTIWKDMIAVPVFGVRPPVKDALQRAKGRHVAVLGVKSLVESAEMRTFAAAEAGDAVDRVHLVNASSLVDLVESGAFLFDQADVQRQVDAFVAALDDQCAGIGAMTLSSTHLPWLRSFLERAAQGRPAARSAGKARLPRSVPLRLMDGDKFSGWSPRTIATRQATSSECLKSSG